MLARELAPEKARVYPEEAAQGRGRVEGDPKGARQSVREKWRKKRTRGKDRETPIKSDSDGFSIFSANDVRNRCSPTRYKRSGIDRGSFQSSISIIIVTIFRFAGRSFSSIRARIKELHGQERNARR